MTRQEAEAAIMARLIEIRDIAAEYSPQHKDLYLSIHGDRLSAWNVGFDVTEGVIDCTLDLDDGSGIFSYVHRGKEDGNAEDGKQS